MDTMFSMTTPRASLPVLMCVPVLVLFAVLQRYLIRGMGIGLMGE